MVHGYDINTSFDFFRKLLDEREDFLKYPHSARYAINCAITGWQLHDWVFAEKDKYPYMSEFTTKNDFRTFLYKQADFKTLHDLADGAKHYQLTSRKTSIENTQVSSWETLRKKRGWKHPATADNKTQLFLTFRPDLIALTMSFDDLLYDITIFWYHLFKNNLKEDVNKLFEEGGYTYF